MEHDVHKKRRGFQFEEMWLETLECKEVVQKSWTKNIPQERMVFPYQRGGSQRLWSKLGVC